MWSNLTDTGLIVNPEEAEKIIPLFHNAQYPNTHLLTYAAPVTRKMLQFNDLKYYAVPNLPKSWTAPTWLKIELGIFAGRLYFEYEEYANLCKFLGVRESEGKLEEMDIDEPMSSAEQPADQFSAEEPAEDTADEVEADTKSKPLQSFTSKPLTFLHEWLAVRRKGQDFAHTPMGHVCQGKPLTASHPFFGKVKMNGATKTNVPGLQNGYINVGTMNAGAAEEDVVSEDEGCDEDVYYAGDDGEDETAVSL